MKYKTLRELVLSHSQEEWFLHNKNNIMFELNHCELHHVDSYFLNLYNAGIKDLDNPNSSNILYLLGMTTVEPHKRIDTVGGGFPDIDSDFSNDKRQQVFDYLKAKYGDGFAHLGTITYTAGKQVFKSAARIHGMPFEKANKISNLMPDIGCPRLEELLKENSDIQKLYNSDSEVKEVWDDAIKLQDCISSTGVHACFIGGTKVTIKRTEDSEPEYMNIEDVKVGYLALTASLNWKPVVDTQVNESKKSNLVHLAYQQTNYDNFSFVKCTLDHPILVINSINDEPEEDGSHIGYCSWVKAEYTKRRNGFVSPDIDGKSFIPRMILDAWKQSNYYNESNDEVINVYNLTVLDDSSYVANGIVVHNCGVALSDRPLWEDVPLWDSKGKTVTQWEGNKIEEYAGIVKLDVLGLKTLGVLEYAKKLIKDRHGIDIDWYTLPMDDGKAYKIMWDRRNYGIFQFEESGMSSFINKCKPKTIHDIAVCVSTWRPGPMGIHGLVERIIGKISGEIPKTDFIFPKYNYIFENAHNELIFQEGFLRLSMDMCGFTEIEADKLRKAVGKKDAALLASLRDKFISGAVASGEDERKVSSFWEELMLFAQYASLAPLYRNI